MQHAAGTLSKKSAERNKNMACSWQDAEKYTIKTPSYINTGNSANI